MELIVHKIDLIEVRLIENIGKTLVKIYYLQFPKALSFMLARPLNRIWHVDDEIDFSTFNINEIGPFAADCYLQGNSVRTKKKFGIKLLKCDTLKDESYSLPFFKNIMNLDFKPGILPENLLFSLHDENNKRTRPGQFNFEKIAHLGYENFIIIESFRQGLSILWAKQLKINVKRITESNEIIKINPIADDFFNWQYIHLKDFTNIPKEYYYRPLP